MLNGGYREKGGGERKAGRRETVAFERSGFHVRMRCFKQLLCQIEFASRKRRISQNRPAASVREACRVMSFVPQKLPKFGASISRLPHTRRRWRPTCVSPSLPLSLSLSLSLSLRKCPKLCYLCRPARRQERSKHAATMLGANISIRNQCTCVM